MTRSSLPGAGVVPSTNRWRARRSCEDTCSRTSRSTPGRQVAATTVGTAKSTSRPSTGLTWVISRISTIARRMTQPSVENNDMNRWSRPNVLRRRISSRSMCSRRSWCAMVATVACSSATRASMAMLIRSRNRRLQPVEDDLQPPHQGRRDGETGGGEVDVAAVVVVQPVDEHCQPEPDERLRERESEGHRDRDDEQPRLDRVGQLRHPPQRAQRPAAGRRRAPCASGVQSRWSWTTSSPCSSNSAPSSSVNREACRSNIVR